MSYYTHGRGKKPKHNMYINMYKQLIVMHVMRHIKMFIVIWLNVS